MQVIKNYINGKFVSPLSGKYIDNYEPATGKVYSRIPDSDARDVAHAAEAAGKTFPLWSSFSAKKRSDILLRIARLIMQHADALALAETRDNGKPLWLSRKVDIPRAAANFEFYAHAITQFPSEFHPTDDKAINYTLRDPLGVAGCISPWNLPLYLFSWKVAPALAAGNCVVAKPSELAPMTAFLLSRLCTKAGLPPGALNIVHGCGATAGAAIVSHPGITAVSFTGGTKTGAEIARTAAPVFKKLSLEMGGKNPNIIFADCNFEQMMETTLRSSFENQGEICLCSSRIFIEEKIYKKFRDEFVRRTKRLRTGDPVKKDVALGALISEEHRNKVLYYIHLAGKEGGKVLTGGKPVRVNGRCRGGWFVSPAVIEGLPFDCRTNQEEIFGPVVTLTPFKKEEEALRYANSTPYGLSATVWTQDITRAHRVARGLKSGIIWINCWLFRDLRTPFGGMKQSGVGREGGFEALRFFTEPKNVCVKL